MSAITFELFPPPASLSRDVEGIRVATYGGDQPLTVKICPNGLPGLVFHISGSGTAIESLGTKAAQLHEVPQLFLHGQGTDPSVMRFKPEPFTSIQVILKPCALYTIFGRDASSLFLGMLQPAEFGGDELKQQLKAATSTGQRIDLLESFLENKLSQAYVRD